MNGEFNPLTARARAVSAGTAVVATFATIFLVLALAGHYDDEFLQVARAQSATGTRHATAPASAHAALASHG